MKRFIMLLVIVVLFIGSSLTFAAVPPQNWCMNWPDEPDYPPEFWYKEVEVTKTCDHPDLTVRTWAFVYGWSKITVSNSEFFWKIYKYPNSGYLEADLTWLGVSSNSGGTLSFNFAPYIASNTEGYQAYLGYHPEEWKKADGSIWYNPDLSKIPNELEKILVDYWVVEKIWDDNGTPLDPNDDKGWKEIGSPIVISPAVSLPVSLPPVGPCCYQYDLYQRIIINSKQLKGVYYGDLTAQFEVTCYTAQTTDPFEPPGFQTNWKQGEVKPPQPTPTSTP